MVAWRKMSDEDSHNENIYESSLMVFEDSDSEIDDKANTNVFDLKDN